MKNESDLRVIKTRRNLAEVLLTHLKQKPFEATSVKSICADALIRRSTFYEHFKDKYDLLSYTTKYVCEKFPSHMFVEGISERDRYKRLMEEFLDFFEKNENIIKNIQNSKEMILVEDIFLERLSRDLLFTIKRYFDEIGRTDIHPELYVNYATNAIFGTYLWWLNEGKPMPKEEIIKQLYSLVMIV